MVGHFLPRQSGQDVACKQHLYVDREEGDEDTAGDEDQRPYHHLPVTDALGENSVDEEANDLSSSSTVTKRRLPVRGDLVSLDSIFDSGRVAVLLCELGNSVEIAQECSICFV